MDSAAQTAANRGAFGMLDANRLASILWDSAVRSLFSSIGILVTGAIAMSMVGSIFKEMMPSKPPGIPITSSRWFGSALPGENFWYGVVWLTGFVYFAVLRLARYLPNQGLRKFIRRFRLIERKVSQNWFELMVGNGIGAMVTATVLVSLPNFSLVSIVWNSFIEPCVSWLIHLFHFQSQGGVASFSHDWWTWYGRNNLQFTFWGIYIASIADDLGLPNLKTMARSGWIKVRNRFRKAPPAPTETSV